MSIEELKALVLKHWQECLPGMVAELNAEDKLDEALYDVARLVEDAIERLMEQGYSIDKALEEALPQYMPDKQLDELIVQEQLDELAEKAREYGRMYGVLEERQFDPDFDAISSSNLPKKPLPEWDPRKEEREVVRVAAAIMRQGQQQGTAPMPPKDRPQSSSNLPQPAAADVIEAAYRRGQEAKQAEHTPKTVPGPKQAIVLQPRFSIPDCSRKTVQSKKDEDGVIDVGWCDGVLSDGRPFRAEMWAQDQVSYLTIFFSTREMQNLAEDAVLRFVENEGLVSFKPGRRYCKSAKWIDHAGNENWSVNIVIGDEEETFLSSAVPIFPYSRYGEPNTMFNPTAIKCAHAARRDDSGA